MPCTWQNGLVYMAKAVFEGLVFDERGATLGVAYIGADPMYVLTEDGFRYHIDAQKIDAGIFQAFRDQIHGNEEIVGDGMMKMMGKDDLFTKAAVKSAIKNMDKNMAQLYETGIPEQARQYLGMMGFRVVVDRHGDLLDVNMPGMAAEDE
jgi:hypothetical protein